MDLSQYKHKIFSGNLADFETVALDVFRFQYLHNTVYRDYVHALSINIDQVQTIAQIPFLPIRFFKTHDVVSTEFQPQSVFRSSGTTGTIGSRHIVRDLDLYKSSFTNGFRKFHGPPDKWCIIGLLPSYLERNDSSLVFMVDELIRLSNHPSSGFYLYEFSRLARRLQELEAAEQPTLLIGVTFALLDFAGQFPQTLKNTVILETGGMKGRRKEMVRDEVHTILQQSFGLPAIHSEYGMTELLSQAYSAGEGIFHCPPWMRVLARDDEDPLTIVPAQRGSVSGAINVIDLANIYSCSFIATDDVGRLYPDNSFEILGRMDNSDIRGCSLMVA